MTRGGRAGAVRTTTEDNGHHLCSFLFDDAFERRDHIVDGESGGVGIGEHAGGERAQPAFVLARRVRLRRRALMNDPTPRRVSMTPARSSSA